jgi:hypothetical protein
MTRLTKEGDIVETEGDNSGRIVGGKRLENFRKKATVSFREAQQEKERAKPGSTDFSDDQKDIIEHLRGIEERGGLGKSSGDEDSSSQR